MQMIRYTKIEPDKQAEFDRLVAILRRHVIAHLLKKEFAIYRQPAPDNASLAFEVEQIAALDCDTCAFPRLFDEARDYRADIGVFPGPPTVADLRFCISKRIHGLLVRNRLGFLPRKSDRELRSLVAFKSVADFVKPWTAKGLMPRPTAQNTEIAQLTDIIHKQISKM